MSWNTQNGLPFSAEGPERQPLSISLGNPPYVPANYNGPAALQQLLPTICAALALDIQQNAPKNPLRTFMFNQYSRDNFNNPDFDALVHAALEYITLEMNNNRYANVEKAAQNCVPQMTEMMTAVNLRLFPQLEAYINQNVVNVLRNTIGNFDRIVDQIKNQRSGGGWGNTNTSNQGGWGNANWGGNQGGGWGNTSFNSNAGSSNRWSGGGGGNWGNTNTARATGNTGSTGLFNGPDRRASSNTTGSGGVTGKWADDNPNPVKQPYQSRDKDTSVNNQAQALPFDNERQTIEAPLASGKIKWKPSATQPYLPACAPSAGEIWLRKYPDGRVEAFLKEKEEVDYTKHVIGQIFGPAPRSLDLSHRAETMAKIEEGIRKINGVVALPESERHTPEVTTLVAPTMLLETTLEAAWIVGGLNRLTAPSELVPDVYRAHARIATPVITKVDESELVAGLAASKTYLSLRDKLSAAVAEGATPGLWSLIETKMTALVNRILQQKLALPNASGEALSIDSFLNDVEDLVSYLGKEYGQNVQQAFLKNQRKEIQSAFASLSEDSAKNLTTIFMAGLKFDETSKPIITYVSSDFSLTYLDCMSYELDVDLAKNLGTLVTATLSPVLHTMLEGLFSEVEESGVDYERHLIMTNDGRVLEAACGYLGEKAYLLTLVK
jgi:hypothetical protein